jgi:hypothetical protein
VVRGSIPRESIFCLFGSYFLQLFLHLYLAIFMVLFSIHGRSMLDVFSPYYPFVAIILLEKLSIPDH